MEFFLGEVTELFVVRFLNGLITISPGTQLEFSGFDFFLQAANNLESSMLGK
jgi:hypothetical protein